MSVHLVACAAESPLRPAEKLVLMCFADSASNQTGIAFPGLDDVMTWSTLGKRQTLAVIAKLVDAGFLERRGHAHSGRRAEFLVFPSGCCQQHGAVNPEGTDAPDDFAEKGADQRTQTAQEEGCEKGCGAAHPIEKGCDFEPIKGAEKGAEATAPLKYLLQELPPPPNSRETEPVPAPTGRAEEEAENVDVPTLIGITDLAEFAAELSVTARKVGGADVMWTRKNVRKAMTAAFVEGYPPIAMPAALRELAADPATRGPIRLAQGGPWWLAMDRENRQARATNLLEHAHQREAERRAATEVIDARQRRQRELFEGLDDDTLERLHKTAVRDVDEEIERTGNPYSAGMRQRLVTTNAMQMAVEDGLVPELDSIDIDTKAAYA